MTYSITINNVKALKWGISLPEAYLFDYLFQACAYRDKIQLEGRTYSFVSRTIVCKDIPIVSDKPDTIYRYYKRLNELGIIDYKHKKRKDLIWITPKGRTWQKTH